MAKQHRHVDAMARLFRLLSDPTRLRILLLLAEDERNVSDLCRRLRMPQPTVSHHLGLLRMGELVNTRRSGKEIFYSLRDIQRDKAGRALKTLLDGSECVRLGPLVLGRVKD